MKAPLWKAAVRTCRHDPVLIERTGRDWYRSREEGRDRSSNVPFKTECILSYSDASKCLGLNWPFCNPPVLQRVMQIYLDEVMLATGKLFSKSIGNNINVTKSPRFIKQKHFPVCNCHLRRLKIFDITAFWRNGEEWNRKRFRSITFCKAPEQSEWWKANESSQTWIPPPRPFLMDLQKFQQAAEMCILCRIILKADVLHCNDMRESNNKWNRFFQTCRLNVIVVICINVLWSIEKQQLYEFFQHLQIQQMPDSIPSFACIERFCPQQWDGGK